MEMSGDRVTPERDDLAAVHRALAPALGNRLASAPALLAVPSGAAATRLEGIDRVVALYFRRLEAFAPPRALVPPAAARRSPPHEMPEPPELPAARDEVDIEPQLREMPPLPEGFNLEPPPIPPTGRTPRAPGTALLPALAADSHTARLLYDDVLWLVSINDWKAAMVSIERLLVSVRFEGTLKEFFEFNEVKLLNLFESFLGTFTKVPHRRALTLDNTMPDAYERAEKLHTVLALVDGTRSLQEILRQSKYTPLESCSALSQARRCGILEI